MLYLTNYFHLPLVRILALPRKPYPTVELKDYHAPMINTISWATLVHPPSPSFYLTLKGRLYNTDASLGNIGALDTIKSMICLNTHHFTTQ